MNIVTGQSYVNPKHFMPNEVNLMVLNCYCLTPIRYCHISVKLQQEISLKTNCRYIYPVFLSLCGNISLPLIGFYLAWFYLLLSLRSINCVMFHEWSISNTIHLSIKGNRRRTDSPSCMLSPTSCHYLFHPCQFYIRSCVSLSSSSLLSCFILCHDVPSLAKPEFWLKAKSLVVIEAYSTQEPPT